MPGMAQKTQLGATCSPALDKYRESSTPPRLNGRESNRAKRYVRRRTSQRWMWADYYAKLEAVEDDSQEIRKPTCGCCGKKLKTKSRVGVRELEGRAHYTGTMHCGSIWLCPVCADVLRRERANEVSEAVKAAQDAGLGCYLVTVTVRHGHDDGLTELVRVLSEAWKHVTSGKAWTSFKRGFGVAGYIRSLEITWSSVNSWHPHYHFIFFTEEEATPEKAEAFREFVLPRWIKSVQREGGKTPTGDGFDCRPVDGDGKALSVYISKVAHGVARELAQSDKKESDERESITPFELLDEDTPRNRALFVEYAEGTKGRSAILFSRGLRKRLGLVKERTDEEILEELETVGDLVAEIEPDVWDDARDNGEALARVLELVERRKFDDVARLLGCAYRVDERVNLETGEVLRWCVYYYDRP